MLGAMKINPSLQAEGVEGELLAAHGCVLGSNLSGVLFASYFNKGAQ